MKTRTTAIQKSMLSLIANGYQVEIRCPRRTISYGRKVYTGEKAVLYKEGEEDVFFNTKTYRSLFEKGLITE